ncbi:MAG: ATP-binding protein [Pirellulales bacterium]|nr:ATP-binding protein [Pirellulales bacterium]
MLLSFSITNYRSFRDEQTLSLFASKRLGGDETPYCREVPGTKEHVLRVASLYGANGAGKSNLVKALQLVQRLVLQGTAPGNPMPCKPFLLDKHSSTEPTLFEIQFVADENVYEYGLCYDHKHVHEEWLHTYKGTRELSVFAREQNDRGDVTVQLGPAVDTKHLKRIDALAKVGARPNQPFLAEVVNLDSSEAQGPHFRNAIAWFSSALTVFAPGKRSGPLAHAIVGDDSFADFAGRFLRDASTGITSLEVQSKKVPMSEFNWFPPELLQRILDNNPERPGVPLAGPEGEEYWVERAEKGQITHHRILALHETGNKNAILLPLRDESDGSLRLLDLLPILYRLTKQDGVFVIDEIERSMHPMLVRKFVEFFLKAVPDAKSQLIFTTHESTLLAQDLMRRDSIWFSEKDNEGATHLYSLADFNVRNDLRIDKGYLQGRFGAIPFLGGLDELMEEQTAGETAE